MPIRLDPPAQHGPRPTTIPGRAARAHRHQRLRAALLAALALLSAALASMAPALAGPPGQKPAEQGPKVGGQLPADLDGAVRSLRSRVDAARAVAAEGDPVHAGRLLIAIVDELTSFGLPADHAAANEVALEAGRAAHHANQYIALMRAWSWLLPRWRETSPANDADLENLLSTFAREARTHRDLRLARELHEDLLARREARMEGDDPALLAATRDLIEVLTEIGDDEAALELLVPYHELQSALLAEDHPELMAARERLANVRFRMGDLEGAALLFRQLLDTVEANREPGDPSIAMTRSNLLHVLYAKEDLRAAVVEEEQAVLHQEFVSGIDSIRLLSARRALAGSLFGLGDLPRSRRLLERVAIEQAQAFSAGDLHLAETRLNLAETLRRMGFGELALPLEETAVLAMDSEDKKDPTQHAWLRRVSLRSVAESALASGQPARAREACEAALALGVTGLADELYLRELLALALGAQGLVQEERALRLETLSGASQSGEGRGLAQVAPQLGFAAHLLGAGEFDEARRLTDLALAEIETLGGPELVLRREALALLGRIALRAEDPARLERACTELARSIEAALVRSADPSTPFARGEDQAELAASDLSALLELAPHAPQPGPLLERAFELLETRRARLVHGSAALSLRLGEVRARLRDARVVAYHVLPSAVEGTPVPHLFALRWDPAGVRLFDLGPLAEIEAAVAAWRRVAAVAHASDPRAVATALQSALGELRARLVAPLLAAGTAEGDGAGLYVLPDGLLHGVALAELFGPGARTLASLLPAPVLSSEPGALVRIGAAADAPTEAQPSAERGAEQRVLPAAEINRVTLARALRGASHVYFELSAVAEAPESAARVRARRALPAGLGHGRPERPEGVALLDLASLALPGRQPLVDSLGKRIDRLEGRELAALNLSTVELCVVTGAPEGGDATAQSLALAGLRSALHGAGARRVLAPLFLERPEQSAQILSAFRSALAEGLEPHAALAAAHGDAPVAWILSERP